MKNNIYRRGLSLVLAVCMTLSTFNTLAYAQDGEEEGITPQSVTEMTGDLKGSPPDTSEPPSCTCPVADSGEVTHAPDCPLYIAPDKPTQEQICTCTALCTEDAVNGECPVCAEGWENCAFTEEQLEVKCTCTALCAEGAVDETCPVCAEGWKSCAFTEEQPELECTCTALCTEGAMDETCPMCAEDWKNCAFAAADPSEAAKAAAELIAALPTAEAVQAEFETYYIAEEPDAAAIAARMEELRAAILAARGAYDGLSEEEKAAFDPVVLEKLAALEGWLAAQPMTMAAEWPNYPIVPSDKVLGGIQYQDFVLNKYVPEATSPLALTGTAAVKGVNTAAPGTVTIPEAVQRQGADRDTTGTGYDSTSYYVYFINAIAENAFNGANGKERNFVLHSGIETIGANAFNGVKSVDVSTVKTSALQNAGKDAFANTVVYVSGESQALAIPATAMGSGDAKGILVRKGSYTAFEAQADDVKILQPVGDSDNKLRGFTMQYKNVGAEWQNTLPDGSFYTVYLKTTPVPLLKNGQPTYLTGIDGSHNRWVCAVKAETDVTNGAKVTVTAANVGSVAIPDFNLSIAGKPVAGSVAKPAVNTPVEKTASGQVQHHVIVGEASIQSENDPEAHKYYKLTFDGNNSLWLGATDTPVTYVGRDNSYNSDRSGPRSTYGMSTVDNYWFVASAGTPMDSSGSMVSSVSLFAGETKTLSIALNEKKIDGEGDTGKAITIVVNGGEPKGGNDLADAVRSCGTAAASITSLDITYGTITETDWGNISNLNLTGLKSFSVASGVTVGDMNANTKFPQTIESVSIPQPVAIASGMFGYCTNLTNVNIPAATKINADAFRGCSALTTANFPAATSVGDNAFDGCAALTAVSLSPNVQSIGMCVFQNCAKLKAVTLPKVARIDYNAFSGCAALTGIELPATPPATVHESAFANCPASRTLTIVDADGTALTEKDALTAAIGAYKADKGYKKELWYGWTLPAPWGGDLTAITITLDGTSASGTSLEDAVTRSKKDPAAVQALTVVTGELTTTDWTWFQGRFTALTDFTIAEGVTAADIPAGALNATFFPKSIQRVDAAGVTAIGNFAFSGCSALASASFPDATSIGLSAFSGCTKLVSISFPKANSIGKEAFRSCNKLTGAAFPKVTAIGEYAFYDCYRMESADFPLAASIGESAFYDCQALAAADFPKVTVLGQSAFYHCYALKSASFLLVTEIPASAFRTNKILETVSFPLVTSIGDYAFSECDALAAPSFPEAKTIDSGAFYTCSALASPSFPKATSIGEYAFYGCGKLKMPAFGDVTAIGENAFQNCKVLSTANFPLVEAIKNYTFQGCDMLSTIDFTAATSIGSNAFEGCSSLKDASFPEVTAIGDSAFYSCRKLSSASFPVVSSIGSRTFCECMSLKTLTLGATPPAVANANAFEQCPAGRWLALVDENGATLTVDALAAAQTAYDGVTDSGTTTDGLWYGWKVAEPVLAAITIKVDGGAEVSGTSLKAAVAAVTSNVSGIKTLEITAGRVTADDWYSLAGGSSEFIFSISNAQLTSFSIAEGVAVEDMDQGANFPRSITTVTIPQTISIGNNAFSQCSKLSAVNIPKATAIGTGAFLDCKALTSVSFPEAVTIGANAFEGCEMLATVTLPKATEIGSEAFRNCSLALTDISLPKATKISRYAFFGCKRLATIDLPVARTISQCAFENCAALRSVSLPAVTSTGGNVFENCTQLASISLPKIEELTSETFKGCIKLAAISLPATPPAVYVGVFDGCLTPRAITFVNADGTELDGDALTAAQKNYDDDTSDDNIKGDGLWYGWTIGNVASPTDLTGKTLYFRSGKLYTAQNGGDEVVGLAGWSGSGKTLTLTDFHYETTALTGLVMPQGSTIVLNGENTIASTHDGDEYADSIGVEFQGGNCYIKGGGTLNAAGGKAGHHSMGIILRDGASSYNNSLWIQGCTVNATGGDCGGNQSAVYGLLSRGNLSMQSGGKLNGKAQSTFGKDTRGVYVAFGTLAIGSGSEVIGETSGTGDNAGILMATGSSIDGASACFGWDGTGYTVPAQVGKDQFDRTTIIGTSGSNTALARAKLANLPQVTIGETPQTATYNGSGWIFTVTPTPEGVTGFTVSYAQSGVTVATPTNAGSYDVTVTRAADSTYTAFEKTIAGGLVISPAVPVLTWPAASQTIAVGGQITPPAVTLTGGETYSADANGEIAYAYKSKTATVASFFRGLFSDGYTQGLPTAAGEYLVSAALAAKGNYAQAATAADLQLTIEEASSDKIAITLDGKTASGESLEAAVANSGKDAESAKILTVNSGELTAADWTWFQGRFTALTDFTIAEGVPAANIPAGGVNAPFFPTTIQRVNAPGVKAVGDRAFTTCLKLVSVSFPDAAALGGYVFHDCSALTSASFPKAGRVGTYAFNGCGKLAAVDFSAATIIDTGAFQGCKALAAPTFPNAKFIGEGAFENCGGLTTPSFPKATAIYASAFQGCKTLTAPIFGEVTDLRASAFYGCTALTSASFPQVETVSGSAFQGCSALASASFPKAITIGDNAFNGCAKLETVTFPVAKGIGKNAFKGCQALPGAAFPQAVTIGTGAFESCGALQTLTLGATPPTAVAASFTNCPDGRKLALVGADGSPLAEDDAAWASYKGAADGDTTDSLWYGWTLPGGGAPPAEGSAENPFLIRTSADLATLAAAVNSGTSYENQFIKIADDADSGLQTTTAIGTKTRSFRGSFDGNGRVITLAINQERTDYQGLFGFVDGGVLKNIGVAGSVSGGQFVGGVVGELANGTVANCSSAATVTARNGNAGGVAGQVSTSYDKTALVENCYNTGNVTTANTYASYAGGVAGCGTSADADNPGGAITIRNCYNTGDISAPANGSSSVGGIVGIFYSGNSSPAPTVENCYNTGTVKGTSPVGGIVGAGGSTAVKNCVSLGTAVTATSGSKYSRVICPSTTGANMLENNQARADMKIGRAGSEKPVTGGAADNEKGKDVAADGSVALSTVFSGWGGQWSVPDGNLVVKGSLPTLAGMPGTQAPVLPEVPPDKTDLTGKTLYFRSGKLYTAASGDDEVVGLDGWEGSGKTLTLTDFHYETTALTGLVMPQGSTIVLNGENTIASTHDGDEYADSIGVEFQGGNCYIKGGGTLNAAGGKAKYRSMGIILRNGASSYNNSLWIQGCTVNATGGDCGGNQSAVYGLLSRGNLWMQSGGKLNGKAQSTLGKDTRGVYVAFGTLVIGSGSEVIGETSGTGDNAGILMATGSSIDGASACFGWDGTGYTVPAQVGKDLFDRTTIIGTSGSNTALARAKLANLPQVTIDRGPSDQTVEVNGRADFTVTASVSGEGALSYQWYQMLGNAPAPETDTKVATTQVFTVDQNNYTATNGKVYSFYCVVSAEGALSATSEVATLTVGTVSKPEASWQISGSSGGSGTVAEAFTAMQGKTGVITLLRDMDDPTIGSGDETALRAGNVTLDIAGKKVNHISVGVSGGTLTIKDSVGGGRLTPPEGSKFPLLFAYSGTLRVESGNFSSSNQNDLGALYVSAGVINPVVELSGGTFTGARGAINVISPEGFSWSNILAAGKTLSPDTMTSKEAGMEIGDVTYYTYSSAATVTVTGGGTPTPGTGGNLTAPLTQDKVDDVFGPGNATLDTTTAPPTITINKDVVADETIVVESPVNVAIDLGGNTITGKPGVSPVIRVEDGANVTIKGPGSVSGVDGENQPGGTGGNGGDGIQADGSLTVDNGADINGGAGGNGATGGNGGDAITGSGNVTINDGSATGGYGGSGSNGNGGGGGDGAGSTGSKIDVGAGGSASGGNGGNSTGGNGTGGTGGNGTQTGAGGSTTVNGETTGGNGGSGSGTGDGGNGGNGTVINGGAVGGNGSATGGNGGGVPEGGTGNTGTGGQGISGGDAGNVTNTPGSTGASGPVITITAQPEDKTVAANGSADFTVEATVSGDRTLIYQWYRMLGNKPNPNTDTPITNAKAFTVDDKNFTGIKGTTYQFYCVLSVNGAESVTTRVATLTVSNVSSGLTAPLTQEKVDNAFGPGNATLQPDGTIKIEKNVILDDPIRVETDVTINLGGHTINGSNGQNGADGKPSFVVVGDHTLTIIGGGTISGGDGGDNPGGTGGNGAPGVDLGPDGSVSVDDGNITGGTGGSGSTGGNGGDGVTGGSNIEIGAGGSASGGNGGNGSTGAGGNGGDGTQTGAGGSTTVDGNTTGGDGGSGGTTGGNGGNGSTSTGSGTIDVGTGGSASGGNGGSGTGNGAGGNGGNGTQTGAGGSTTVGGNTTGGSGGMGSGTGDGGDGGNGTVIGGGTTAGGNGTATGGDGGNIPGGGSGDPGAAGAGVSGGNAGSVTNIPGKAGYKVTTIVDDTKAGTTVTVPEKDLADAVVTQEDIDNNRDVKVKLIVEKKQDAAQEQPLIEQKLDSLSANTIGIYFDITLEKTVTENGAEKPPETITNANKPIEITITIPVDMRGGSDYVVIRVHDGVATALATRQKKDTLTFETDRFSTYAIAYTPGATPPPTPPSSGGHGGASSSADNDQYEFWMDVKDKISAAQDGDIPGQSTQLQPGAPETVTPPDAGFQADSYVDTPDAKMAGHSVNGTSFAIAAVIFMILAGYGVWTWKKKKS